MITSDGAAEDSPQSATDRLTKPRQTAKMRLPETLLPAPLQSSEKWKAFEQRRHHYQPPNLFDEGVKKFEKFSDKAFATRHGGLDDGDLSLQKARFFDGCLRADKSLERLKLPHAGFRVPHSARGHRSSEDPNDEEASPHSLKETLAGLMSSCRLAKLHPATTGIVRPPGEKLKLEYGFLTDRRAEVISGSLQASVHDVQEALFRSNGLSSKGARHLLKALPSNVLSVDLSQNGLGHGLGDWPREFSRLTHLQQLRICEASLSDAICEELCEALASCQQLRTLDLSGNQISHGASAIGGLLISVAKLESLDLHWNSISGSGALDLAQGLLDNCEVSASLRSLDLSWNPIGKGPWSEVEATCRTLARYFASTKVLSHLDISSCYFSASLCEILATGLKENSSILGLHVLGNEAHLGPSGDVFPMGSQLPTSSFSPVITPVRLDCCWMCDRWVETRISYHIGISGPAAQDVWLFTSTYGFETPIKMLRHEDEFLAYVMAPAAEMQYFFQAGTEVFPSRTAPQLRLSHGFKIRRQKLPEEAKEADSFEVVDAVNVLLIRPQSAVAIRQAVPRHLGELRDLVAFKVQASQSWCFERSLFAPYEESLGRHLFIDQAFQADLSTSQLVVYRNEQDREKTRATLLHHYAELKLLHSSLSSLELCRARELRVAEPLFFGLCLPEFITMLVQHNILAEGRLSLAEADAVFVLAAFPLEEAKQWHPAAQSQGHVILRHGFFDLLVLLAVQCFAPKLLDAAVTRLPSEKRVARDKSSSKAKTVSSAVDMLLEKHIMSSVGQPHPPMKNNYRCVQWRVDVLHSEAVDNAYRKHMQTIVLPLFTAFSSERRSEVLWPEDWFDFLDALKVLPNREGPLARIRTWDRVWLWEASAMTHLDVTKSHRHLELHFVEFLEALGRLVRLLRARKVEPEAHDFEVLSPAAAFCDEKDCRRADVFATHLESFFTSDSVSEAIRTRKRAAPHNLDGS